MLKVCFTLVLTVSLSYLVQAYSSWNSKSHYQGGEAVGLPSQINSQHQERAELNVPSQDFTKSENQFPYSDDSSGQYLIKREPLRQRAVDQNQYTPNQRRVNRVRYVTHRRPVGQNQNTANQRTVDHNGYTANQRSVDQEDQYQSNRRNEDGNQYQNNPRTEDGNQYQSNPRNEDGNQYLTSPKSEEPDYYDYSTSPRTVEVRNHYPTNSRTVEVSNHYPTSPRAVESDTDRNKYRRRPKQTYYPKVVSFYQKPAKNNGYEFKYLTADGVQRAERGYLSNKGVWTVEGSVTSFDDENVAVVQSYIADGSGYKSSVRRHFPGTFRSLDDFLPWASADNSDNIDTRIGDMTIKSLIGGG